MSEYIDFCIICGRAEKPTIDDICADCHITIFSQDFLEDNYLKKGQLVKVLVKGRWTGEKAQVMEEFNAGWRDEVSIALMVDGDLTEITTMIRSNVSKVGMPA